MSNLNIWAKYEKIEKIDSNGNVFKAKNKENGNYVAIKIINKSKYVNENQYLSEIKILNELKSENSVSIIEILNDKDYCYIIMELCLLNLNEYMKIRKEGFSIEELKDLLNDLNEVLKKMNELGIVYTNLKLSNILICLNKINKISFKLCDFGMNKYMKNELSLNLLENYLTMAPEILENGDINNKNDIWSLGIIIYYLLFKEYPYKGKTEILLNNDIHSDKELKKSNNNELNDLLNKMICVDLNKRISWNDYFSHSFFKQNNNNNNEIKYPKFEFNCNIHNKIIGGYCKNCKMNICDECLNNHNNHNIIGLNKIGMSDKEILKTNELIKEIEINMKNMNKIKEDIISFLNKIKLNKNIINDDDNNFKKYYIEYLEIIKEKLNMKENIIILDLNRDKYKIFNKKEKTKL